MPGPDRVSPCAKVPDVDLPYNFPGFFSREGPGGGPSVHLPPGVQMVGRLFVNGWFLCNQPFAGEWHLSYMDEGYNVKGWKCNERSLGTN